MRRYLEALEHDRPKRGRKRTPESVRSRLDVVHEQLTSAEPLARLHLLQERADLQAELDRATTSNELATLEAAFVKVARAYGERKGIEYPAWRAAGVSAAVLQRAEITRTTADNGTTKAPRSAPKK